jgi:hypothetical protein
MADQLACSNGESITVVKVSGVIKGGPKLLAPALSHGEPHDSAIFCDLGLFFKSQGIAGELLLAEFFV